MVPCVQRQRHRQCPSPPPSPPPPTTNWLLASLSGTGPHLSQTSRPFVCRVAWSWHSHNGTPLLPTPTPSHHCLEFQTYRRCQVWIACTNHLIWIYLMVTIGGGSGGGSFAGQSHQSPVWDQTSGGFPLKECWCQRISWVRYCGDGARKRNCQWTGKIY